MDLDLALEVHVLNVPVSSGLRAITQGEHAEMAPGRGGLLLSPGRRAAYSTGADLRVITERTVKVHRGHAMRKLGATSAAEMVSLIRGISGAGGGE